MKMCCTCTFLELLRLQTVCNFYNYTYNGVIKALGMGAAVTMLLQVQLSLHAILFMQSIKYCMHAYCTS